MAPARRSGARRARSQRDDRRKRRVQLIAAAAAAVVAVIGLIWLGDLSAAPGAPAPSVAALAEARTRGTASAPVVIEEWADFQCPACASFAGATEPQLFASYVAKGQVRFVFHDFAFLGNESQWAAEAAQCAGEQGRFWDYHDRLYASQVGENRGGFSNANLKKIADALGLGPAFAACLDSGRHDARVRADTSDGRARGVKATPTLFVNGRKIEGAIPFDQLKAIIDPLLPAR